MLHPWLHPDGSLVGCENLHQLRLLPLVSFIASRKCSGYYFFCLIFGSCFCSGFALPRCLIDFFSDYFVFQSTSIFIGGCQGSHQDFRPYSMLSIPTERREWVASVSSSVPTNYSSTFAWIIFSEDYSVAQFSLVVPVARQSSFVVIDSCLYL